MNSAVLRKRTLFVLAITILTMIAEITFGIITHSMSLTADGFHMGTHAIAFFITLIVCNLVIKYQKQEEKINAVGGYTSAILLGITSIGIIYESVNRFFNPLNISFEEAILVAIIGLVTNIICALIMGGDENFHRHTHEHSCVHHSDNLNFKAAYFHILADALTSILAIFALLCGKYLGFVELDSVSGLTGGIIIAKWAIDLIKSSLKILLEI